MRNELTAITERDGPWFVGYCAEVPGANGQGKTHEECLANLREAIALILEYRREEALRALPPDAKQEPVIVGWSARGSFGACVGTVAVKKNYDDLAIRKFPSKIPILRVSLSPREQACSVPDELPRLAFVGSKMCPARVLLGGLPAAQRR